jgi:hypothetical protein
MMVNTIGRQANDQLLHRFLVFGKRSHRAFIQTTKFSNILLIPPVQSAVAYT